MEWSRFAQGGVGAALRRVVLWYGAFLLAALSIAWLLGLSVDPRLIVIGALVFYIDVFGIDGGAVYGIAKILGGRASFERHVGFVSWWKPPILALQILGLLLGVKYAWGVYIYYLFILAELLMFWITFREIHRLNTWKSALLMAILATVMFPAFLEPGAVRGLTNILAKSY